MSEYDVFMSRCYDNGIKVEACKESSANNSGIFVTKRIIKLNAANSTVVYVYSVFLDGVCYYRGLNYIEAEGTWRDCTEHYTVG